MSKKEQIQKINDNLERKIIEIDNAISEVVMLSKLLKNAIIKSQRLSNDTYLETQKVLNDINQIEKIIIMYILIEQLKIFLLKC